MLRSESESSFHSSDYKSGTKRAKIDDTGLLARNTPEEEEPEEEIDMDEDKRSMEEEEMITT